MAKSKGNSFEARENKSRKRSSIVKMSELREENTQIINSFSQAEIEKQPTSNEVVAPKVTLPESSKPAPTSAVKSDNYNAQPLDVKNNNYNAQSVEANNYNGQSLEVKTENNSDANQVEVKTEYINTTTEVAKREEEVQRPLDTNNLSTNYEKQNLQVEEVAAHEEINEDINEVINEDISEIVNITSEEHLKDILMVDETEIVNNKVNATTEKSANSKLGKTIENDDFFNLNVKNDVFNGKITTVRVYDDILDKMKKYAGMKNYQIIEFTNKIITMGLDDINKIGVLEISEIKLKNNTSRSIMYNLTDTMDEKLTKYIKLMHKKGYKISRNVILNVVLNETLKKFY
ncbi:MAG: hypothetical protein ACRC68_09915 [Clostridium sp.]